MKRCPSRLLTSVGHLVSRSVQLLEEQRQGLAHCKKSYTAANREHDGLLHVLISVLHLEINGERADQCDDSSNGLHQVAHRGLVVRHLRDGFRESAYSFALGEGHDGTEKEHSEEGGYTLHGDSLACAHAEVHDGFG